MPSEYSEFLRLRTQRVQLTTELRAQYESGTTIRALADSTRIAYSTIRRLLIEAGATLRPRGGSNTLTGPRTDLTTRVKDALDLLDGTLPQHLLDAAHLRLEHPQATLAQLAAIARPPMSAAAVYAHLRTVLRLAERARRSSANQHLRERRGDSAAPVAVPSPRKNS
ncbi:helix-turn-helix domain-containing protein [Streptomyces sp. NPDC048527]|uniref:helix-turn-helix domain-containing protein n=1 Tax=Streptomyces sp. NPDC048527 TaxID=3365568 RepID=UPI0037182049